MNVDIGGKEIGASAGCTINSDTNGCNTSVDGSVKESVLGPWMIVQTKRRGKKICRDVASSNNFPPVFKANIGSNVGGDAATKKCMTDNSYCDFGDGCVESIDHILRRCDRAKLMWNQLGIGRFLCCLG
ncbi:hypothetical protein D8674_024737 [Pyrus ussuriensis x Pyrus communis]|uniref:Uncharacterized protein n=1 Tax=Pyrus ussuriensis x Pyrus communis TaxID=2448454 RepID=A0A5N5H3S6_9ROSA|nr:hypothetical protein D8674_024737 [Pyrus ussuriensis x Pyrus communis]